MVAGEHSLSGDSNDEQELSVDQIIMVLIIFCRNNFSVLMVFSVGKIHQFTDVFHFLSTQTTSSRTMTLQ